MNNKLIALLLLAFLTISCGGEKFSYQTFKNDPTETRLYTLDNGLKVYMSVMKDQPRVQTLISVKVGGKNDPATQTGLAHYFEHLMFKGSESFGTLDYAKEKPILDEIEQQFEEYKTITDLEERKAKYAIIDSLSYEASKYAIPNEYDKMMSSIGARGTNAWTSYDATTYIEDIPSNEIERWLQIESDRFKNVVIRGFHTELETVYEEKNMSLTNDNRKIFEALNSSLFSSHPYGTQTVLGTQENLKNPSITAIKEYYKKWYVPNNMAIALSGDFDPDTTIELINRYFGDMKKSDNLEKLNFEAEKPIEKPIVSNVYGSDAESVAIGYRFGGAKSGDMLILTLIDALLNNGSAGLIDLNIMQKQKMLSAYCGINPMSDYSQFILLGRPKEGQSLEEAKDILLEQIELLKKGEFDESLLRAAINNYKFDEIKALESYSNIANMQISSFINGQDWGDVVSELDKMSSITKDEVTEFASKHFGDNYAVIYKHTGKDSNEQTIEKPQITPIIMNRDSSSLFLTEMLSRSVEPIEPHFVDYDKDMRVGEIRDSVDLLYKHNNSNGRYSLVYTIDLGSDNDKFLPIASQYYRYLGTSTMSAEEIKQKFYELASSFSISVGEDKSSISLSGLNENMDSALELMESVLSDLQPNQEALENLKRDIYKSREDAKLNKDICASYLQRYAMCGAEFVKENTLSNSDIKKLSAQQLISALKELNNYNVEVLYYGPLSFDSIKTKVLESRPMAAVLKSGSESENKNLITKENKVFFAPYDAAQVTYGQYSNRGDLIDADREAVNSLYNSYFGGGMNSIVFQEMRESRGLAYSARAGVYSPYDKTTPYRTIAFIATQSDKLHDAIEAFEDIICNMPTSQAAFDIAKEGLLTSIRTTRTTKEAVLSSYLSLRRRGLDSSHAMMVYNALQELTLEDVVAYQQQYVKENNWFYYLLGKEDSVDLKSLEKYGKVEKLTLTDIFGY